MNKHNVKFSQQRIEAMFVFAENKIREIARNRHKPSGKVVNAKNADQKITEADLWALLRPDDTRTYANLSQLFEPLQRIIEGDSVIFLDRDDEDSDDDEYEPLPEDPEDVVMLSQILLFVSNYGVNTILGEHYRLETLRKSAMAKLTEEEIKALGLEKN